MPAELKARAQEVVRAEGGSLSAYIVRKLTEAVETDLRRLDLIHLDYQAAQSFINAFKRTIEPPDGALDAYRRKVERR